MIIYMEEAYDAPPNFEFNPKAGCKHNFTCVNVTRDGDSITFAGKLTSVPTNYTATLADGKKFTFVFGKEVPIESTVAPTTKPSLSTDQPNQTQPVPSEQTTSSGESNGNETGGGGGDEHATVPTTSSGRLNKASVAVLILVLLTPVMIQLLS